MSFNNNIDNDIDRYLNEDMSIKEQAIFENKIKEDQELSERIELQRDIAAYLQSDKMQLAKELDVLGDKFFIEKKRPNSFNKIWLFLPALFLLGGMVWFFQEKGNTSSIIPIKKNIEITSPPIAPTDTSKEIIKNVLPLVKPDEIKEKKKSIAPVKIKEEQPIASIDPTNYKPNPLLESLLKETVRAASFVTIIETLPTGKIIKKNNTIPLNISGNTTAKMPYQLIIYSNRGFDFERDYRLFDQALLGTKKGEVYYFDYKANLNLEKGLYYLLLKEQASSEILSLSKFTVE